MFRSMTAFGRERKTIGNKDITVEVKSVNNRFFDCSVKLPKMYGFLEDNVKKHLQVKGISRGKIDVSIAIETLSQEGVEIAIDEGYAKSYIEALCKLRDRFGLKDDITLSRVAANKDIFVVKQADEDNEKDWEEVREVLDCALDRFIERRETEGDNLCKNITEKVENIREYVKETETHSGEDINGYANRLQDRIEKFLNDHDIIIDQQRILTEVAIFADKVAIDEEIVRLRSHFDAFYEIVNADEPAGRKLDFLVQEMNREVNTIGSKASNSDVAHIVVNIKNELEKIREQIQNIE